MYSQSSMFFNAHKISPSINIRGTSYLNHLHLKATWIEPARMRDSLAPWGTWTLGFPLYHPSPHRPATLTRSCTPSSSYPFQIHTSETFVLYWLCLSGLHIYVTVILKNQSFVIIPTKHSWTSSLQVKPSQRDRMFIILKPNVWNVLLCRHNDM